MAISKKGDLKVDKNWLIPKFKEFLEYFNKITNNALKLKNEEFDYISLNSNKNYFDKINLIYEKSSMMKSHRCGIKPTLKRDVKLSNMEDFKKELFLNFIFNKFEEKSHFIKNNKTLDFHESLIYELCSEHSKYAVAIIKDQSKILKHTKDCPVRTMSLRHVNNTIYSDIVKAKRFANKKISYEQCEKYYNNLVKLTHRLYVNSLKNTLTPEEYEKTVNERVESLEKNLIFSSFFHRDFIDNLKYGADIKKTFEYQQLSYFLTENEILKVIKKNPLYQKKEYRIFLTKEIEEMQKGLPEYKEYYQHYLELFNNLVAIGKNADFLTDKENISKKTKSLLKKIKTNPKVPFEDMVENYILNHKECFFKQQNLKDEINLNDNRRKFNKIFNLDFYKNKNIELITEKENYDYNQRAVLDGNAFEKKLVSWYEKPKNRIVIEQYFGVEIKEAALIKETKKAIGGCKTDLVLKGKDYLGCSVKYAKKDNDINLGDITIENLSKLMEVKGVFAQFMLGFYHNPMLFTEKFKDHPNNTLIQSNHFLEIKEIEAMLDYTNLPRLDWDKFKEMNPELHQKACTFFEKEIRHMAMLSLTNNESFLKIFIKASKEDNKIKLYDIDKIKKVLEKSEMKIHNNQLSLFYQDDLIFQVKTYVPSSKVKNKESFEYYKNKGQSRGVLYNRIFNHIEPFHQFQQTLPEPFDVKEISIEQVVNHNQEKTKSRIRM